MKDNARIVVYARGEGQTATTTLPSEIAFASDGVKLHGLDWGGAVGATPMVLLHGCGSNAWTFGAVAPLLRAGLGDSYRIVAIDQRGAGDSDKPPSGYGPSDFARDVLAVQEALGGQPMVLVGHSRGGWQAAYLAGRWPERVRQLVLIDPARIMFATPQDADDFYAAVRANLGPFASPEAAIAYAREREPRARWTPERERAFLFGFEERADGSLVGKMPGCVVDQLRQAREETDSVGPLLDRVSMPVLLLVASTSDETRQQQKLEYARRIAHARVEFLDGTHALQLDVPERVCELVVELLRTRSP